MGKQNQYLKLTDITRVNKMIADKQTAIKKQMKLRQMLNVEGEASTRQKDP